MLRTIYSVIPSLHILLYTRELTVYQSKCTVYTTAVCHELIDLEKSELERHVNTGIQQSNAVVDTTLFLQNSQMRMG